MADVTYKFYRMPDGTLNVGEGVPPGSSEMTFDQFKQAAQNDVGMYPNGQTMSRYDFLKSQGGQNSLAINAGEQGKTAKAGETVNGVYNSNASLAQQNAYEQAIKDGTMKAVDIGNGVIGYQPVNAASFAQGIQGQPTGQLSLGISGLGNKLASAGSPDSGTYQTAYTPAQDTSSNMPPGINLQPGMKGDAVKQLQQYLVANRYMTQQQMDTGPGIYGPQTTAAVAKLQASKNVDNSSGPGYYGPKTIAAIQSSQPSNTQQNQQGSTPVTNIQNGGGFQSTGNENIDTLFGGLKDYLTNTLASGYRVNPNLDITPELISKFLADSHQVIDPKYQQILTNEIGNINASLKSLGTNYQNQQGQTVQDFQSNLANSREDASDKGTVFSGQRGLNEQNALNTTNRNLNALDTTYQKNIGDTLRTGASQVGQGASVLVGSTNDFTMPSNASQSVNLEGARGGVSNGGALDYGYNPSNYNYGTIPGNFDSALKSQSDTFTKDYFNTGINNEAQLNNTRNLQTLTKPTLF